MTEEIGSPCTGACALDDAAGICAGCGRTMVEIIAWAGLGDQEKQEILAVLPARLAGKADDL